MAREVVSTTEIMDTIADAGSGGAMSETRRPVRYRSHSLEEKRRVVHECLTSGDSVSIIARRHNLNANQVFHWRKQHERGELGPRLETSTALRLLAVRIEDPATPEPPSVTPAPPALPTSWIEIECARPYRVRVHGAVDRAALSTVLKILASQ